MPSSVVPQPERWLLGALLGTALVLPCLFGFATSYVLIILALVAAGYLAIRRDVRWSFDLPAKIFAAAFLVLVGLFALTAKAPGDVPFAVNFVAFLLYMPMATLFGRAASPGNSRLIAWLALAGAGLGCAIAIVEVYGLGAGRAGLFITDTIRLGNTAVILGFLSLLGIVVRTDRRRWLFLLGPAFALVTVLLTGARGAMLAFPVLAFVAAVALPRRRWLGVLIGSGVVAMLLVAAFTGLFASARMDSMLDVLGDLANGAAVGDEAVRIRLVLYQAGWEAFLQSPIIGHGWANMMTSLTPFLADTDKVHTTWPHLHNDVLNFAVFGGIVGVLLYVVLVAMPFVAAKRQPRDSQHSARLFGLTIVAVSYVVMGLPDTMLSFELHTALYVGLVAVLLAYCRDAAPS